MPMAPQHSLVYHDSERWAAVPANNGGNSPIWQWGDELLVGFTLGTYAQAEKGHQCDYEHPFESWLARSTDGGETWACTRPRPYAGQGEPVSARPEPIDFSEPNCVLRVEGAGYHGNTTAGWFVSSDRGKIWSGPFGFGALLDHPDLKGREFTARTAYLINGPIDASLFLSVREPGDKGSLGVKIREKTFLARTRDGGMSFEFVAWIVPWADPYRAVMPAPVRIDSATLVVALRRKSPEHNWIDCFSSDDNGLRWSFLSKIADTEDGNNFNGNPPAMIRLGDSRLCCVYGNRSRRQIIARYSDDEGATWPLEQVIRTGFESANGSPDLGYVRLYQRTDRKLVAVYFWCTPSMPQTHIEATIFETP